MLQFRHIADASQAKGIARLFLYQEKSWRPAPLGFLSEKHPVSGHFRNPTNPNKVSQQAYFQ
jgi:hypothetical protein